MKNNEVKLQIMSMLLPYYDMFESGKLADEIIKEFQNSGLLKKKFYVKISKNQDLEITLKGHRNE
jgi:hypothetical protein